MYSSYQHEATFHADMTLSIHDRINDLCARAERLAPCVYESALVSGCTDTRPDDGHPRSQKAWDMVAESHGWNAVSDRPDMLALAEEMHVNRKPFYVGYAPKRGYRPVLVDESGMFGFGIWVPEDDAEATAEPAHVKTCKHDGCVLTGEHTHGQAQEYVPALGRSFPADPPLQVTEDEPAQGFPIPPCEMPNEHARQACPCYGASELTECENCGAPCDGSCTARSELTGEDLPVCVTCVPLLTLVAGGPAGGSGKAWAAGYRRAQEDEARRDGAMQLLFGDRVRNVRTGDHGTVKAVSDRRAGVRYDGHGAIVATPRAELARISRSVTETAMPAVSEVKNDLDSATLRSIRHASARWYAMGRLDAVYGHPACGESAADFADQYESAAEALWAGQRSYLPGMHEAYAAWTRGEAV
jgi:hypothetical protein